MTTHWRIPSTQKIQSCGFDFAVGDASSAFHNYGVLWEEDRLIYFIDRKPVSDIKVPIGFDDPMYMPPVFRFAPSPNGLLHLGHAYSALLNFDRAREAGGRLLLRIEDIDATRCRPEFEAAIYEDLAWLGIAWEMPVRRQSEHLAEYRTALEELSAVGLVYPAFESRAEIARLVTAREADGPWPRDPDGAPLYPGHAKSLTDDERARLIASGAPYALRLDMEKSTVLTLLGAGQPSLANVGPGVGGNLNVTA